jgi:hypothetical protein
MSKKFYTKSKLLINSLIVLIFFIFTGCKKGCTDPSASNYDPGAKTNDASECEYEDNVLIPFDGESFLINLSDNFITPSIELYKNSVDDLVTATNNFNSDMTTAKLDTLKNSWYTALLNWQGISFIGPSKYLTTTQIELTNIFPVDTLSVIDNLTNNYSPTDNDQEGFQAIDYLLFSKNSQETIDYFNNNSFASQYLSILVDNISIITNDVHTKWANEKQDFVNNNTSVSNGSSISLMTNALNKHYEYYIRRGKFGLPLNVFDQFSQEVDPHLVECYYYGQSLPFAIRAIESLQNFVKGCAYDNSEDNLLGFDDYLDHVGAEYDGINLSIKIDDQFDEILVALNGLNDPLSDEIQINKSQVDNAYDELQTLVPLLKADLTSALGVQITYADNDGD